MEFCKLAIVETKERAAELIEHLERRVGDLDGSIRINLNGCPNACAQYQIADIGLQGGIARLPDGSRVQGFILHIGGRLGEDAGFGRRVVVQGDARPTTPATRSSGSCAPTKAERRRATTSADWARGQADARLAPSGRRRGRP